MIAAIIILGLLIVVLLVLRDRERQAHEKLLQGFADRIQHPEVRQVQPWPHVEYETPKDLAEMAFVGQEVPAGYTVGMTDEGDYPLTVGR